MRLADRPFAHHAAAALAAAAVLTLAVATQERPPEVGQQATVGPAPDGEYSGLPDACSRRVGCLKR